MTQLPANMALQRTRRPRLRSGRSRRSLGSPLNARPLDAAENCGAPHGSVVSTRNVGVVPARRFPPGFSRGGPEGVLNSGLPNPRPV